MTPSIPQRVLALLFPNLPIERRVRREARDGRAPVTVPRALVEEVAGACRLAAVDARAAAAGLRPGLALADARARLPVLHVEEADPSADRRLLDDLADWAGRWTPLVGTAPPDALVLDVTGCTHLFGGESALLTAASARLTAFGFTVQAALAPNTVAALAFARAAPGALVDEDDLAARLRPLPLTALGLPGTVADGLSHLGLKRIGDLAARPRAPLARRFGTDLMARLDAAHGRRGTPLTPRRPVAPYLAERRFLEPLTHRDDVVAVARALAHDLGRRLAAADEGARRLELTLYRADGGVLRFDIGTSRPTRDGDLIAALVRERLAAVGEGLDVGFGLDIVRLGVLEAGPAAPHQPDFDGETGALPLARLVDRLGARLGPERLERLVPRTVHLPEAAEAALPAALHADMVGHLVWAARASAPVPERPLRLFATPEPIETLADVPEGPPRRFRWRRALHDVAHAEGPERLAAAWWRVEGAGTRDYFRVEDRAGARFWVYREGLYGAGDPPRWFLHGVFA